MTFEPTVPETTDANELITHKHILIGKRIIKVSLNADRDKLLFDLETGPSIVADARDSGYTTTWIAGIDDPDAMIGTVRDVEDLDLTQPNERIGNSSFRAHKYYGCKITTNTGICVIDYRNTSTNHYGGSLDWPRREWEVEDEAKDRALNEQEDPDYYEWKQVVPNNRSRTVTQPTPGE